MIASQKIGKSFMGALNYNMKKLNHPDAKLRAKILAHNFANLNVAQIKAEVEALRQLRPNLNRYVYHTSLNFSAGELDTLDNAKLTSIAEDYLHGLGFTNNLYLVFRHHDADHPHLHLLVNRICFDGTVVSDSNNYKKSEALLRQLEYQYNLIPVEQSKFRAVEQGTIISVEPNNYVSQKAPKKNEIEKAVRTNTPSDKMILQSKLNKIINHPNLTMTNFIRKCEQRGIHLLFNQASTGRVSGITYFHNDFKIKGQALGNRFKWNELIKNINYEQNRDSPAVSAANAGTKSIYGEQPAENRRTGTDQLRTGNAGNFEPGVGESASDGELNDSANQNAGRPMETGQNGDILYDGTANHLYHSLGKLNIEISDDVDDESVYGPNRSRNKAHGRNRR